MFLQGSCCDSCSLGDAEADVKSPSTQPLDGLIKVVGAAALVTGIVLIFRMDKVKRAAGRARYVRYRMHDNLRTTSELPAFESMSDVVYGRRA